MKEFKALRCEVCGNLRTSYHGKIYGGEVHHGACAQRYVEQWQETTGGGRYMPFRDESDLIHYFPSEN